MRFDRIRARGMGVLGEVDIDMGALPGPIVAVVGPNGAGKSTLLESMVGAVYRATPTRGSLGSLATRRDAFLEVHVTATRPWVLRHVLDHATGKADATAIDADGRPATPTGKVRDFDAWVRANMPAPEIVFASMFGAQADGGFLAQPPGARKATLLRALGIERLEALSAMARERHREAKAVHQTLVQTVERYGDPDARRAAAAAALARCEAAGPAIAEQLETARRAVAECDAQAAVYDGRIAEWARTCERLKALRGTLAMVENQRADLLKRIENNRGLLDRAEAIRAGAADAATYAGRIASLEEMLRNASRDILPTSARQDSAQRDLNAAQQRLASARARATSIIARLERIDAVDLDDVREALDFAAGVLQDRLAELEKAEIVVAQLRGTQLDGAAGRIGTLRGGLYRVTASTTLVDAIQAARIAIDADEDMVASATHLPERLGRAEGTVTTLRRDVEHARQRHAEAQRAAAAHAGRADLVAARDAETEAIAQAEADVAHFADAHARATRLVGEARSIVADTEAMLQNVRDKARAVPDMPALLARLEQAEARLAELEPRLVDLDQRIADAKREEAELAAVPMPPAPPNTDGPRRALREAEDRWAAHTAAMAEHRAAIAAAETAAVGRADALAQCAAAEVDAADWGALATDLGRDGLQALEIDGAGPEMTAMVNDLLHTCYGPRWTVTIDASRTSADGRRQLEGCEVTVIDTVEGRTGPGETFSGGERVILGEAIALALSALAARRQGIEDVTLIRDETGAALDVDAARAYVAMLRRGAAAMGASRVFLVTHNPDIQAMADSRIVVGGGTASVMEA